MGRKPKSAEVRARFFTARASGATLKQAVAAAGVSKTTGHYWLTQSGGVRPRVRRGHSRRCGCRWRSGRRSLVVWPQKKTLTAIAASSAGRRRRCRARWLATAARTGTARRARTGWRCCGHPAAAGKLAEDPTLRRYVEDKLRLRWSPQQISRRLIIDILRWVDAGVPRDDLHLAVCADESRAGYGADFASANQTRPPPSAATSPPRSQSRRIPDMVPISQRPDSVLNRTVPGHWEGDLLVGRYGRSHMVTLVERHSRYLVVLPLLDATTRTVVAAVTAAFQQLRHRCADP